MVRTKADGGARKAVAAKAPRKVLASGNSGSGGASFSSPKAGKAEKYAGGNVACPRPTPDWQKGISGFFTSPPSSRNIEKENSDPVVDKNAQDEGGSPTSVGSSPTSVESVEVESQSEEMEIESSTTETTPVKKSTIQKNGLISDSDDE